MTESPLELTDEMKIIKRAASYYLKTKYSGVSAFVTDALITDFAIYLGRELEDYRSGTVI